MQKNLFITYFLWFFFGWFGLHHIYLGRDRQAFVWWSTLGGMFSIGWFRDIWRIPEYVDEANEEKYYMEDLNRKIKLKSTPPFNTTRFAGQMAVGYFYGLLVRLAIPEEVPDVFLGFLVPIGISAGVFIVGSIGRERGPFYKPYLMAVLVWHFLRVFGGRDVSFMYCALAASCMFNYYRYYSSSSHKEPIGARIRTFLKRATIIWLLWCSFFYFNAYITTENNEKIRLRDTVNHFFKSPAWLDFKQTIWRIFSEGRSQGWEKMYDEFVTAMDPTGETNAYNVLEVPKTASEEEIRKVYKKLVVKWHPDRYKGPDKKKAELKFIEIQQAYEILSKRKKSSRARKDNVRTEF